MNAADGIDIGPEAEQMAGLFGFQGNQKDLLKDSNSFTAKYLTNKLKIKLKLRRKWKRVY